MNVGHAERERWAGGEVESLLRLLPGPVAERARDVAILLERSPSAEQVRDGIDPELMGLFEGDALTDEATASLPPRIYLFLDNIWGEADGEPALFREEVRITLLHELGHYLGLDEEDLAGRELD